jgi:hypothetical protein
MSELLDKATKLAVLWKLARAKIILYSAGSLIMSWLGLTNNIKLTDLGAWEWFQTIVACVGGWTVVMVAFIDKTAAQVAEGQMPGLDIQNPKDDTAFTVKNNGNNPAVLPPTIP